ALDAASEPQMVGCVCGDDTVLIVMRTEQAARELQQKIDRICK
ncbi:MAG: arginine repressor, partial [Oscillospiraceae bacterium]|nr:arginine repressor [Oscillospiraceae bacterium]